jgi:hypothetical protein
MKSTTHWADMQEMVASFPDNPDVSPAQEGLYINGRRVDGVGLLWSAFK